MDSFLQVTNVYEALREDILEGRLASAERLVTQRLAERAGVSRTPIKEALARLEAEGLVERQGNWGYAVRTITTRDAEDMFESRLVIEVAAARLAAQRASAADIDFVRCRLAESRSLLDAKDLVAFQHASREVHERIVVATGNGILLKMFRQVNDLVLLFGISLLKADPQRAADILTENRSIVDALAARDPQAAEARMRAHIERGHSSFRGAVGRVPLAIRAV
jgi:DNA-binding GntR family transcriptional regulator